jgi:hypothetical protein
MFKYIKLLVLFQPFICLASDISNNLESDSVIKKSTVDSVKILPLKSNQFFAYSKKREQLVTYAQIAGYSANFASLYYFWYKDYPLGEFHFFNDDEEYLQMDKVSHLFGAYTGGRMSMQMWKWSGVPKKKYVWLGGLTGLGYLTIIEVMDGFSPKWGFSWGDYAANTIGTGLLIGQELLWDEQRIQVKYSTHYQTYHPDDLERFATYLYGKDKINRLFKDYNPQTYWLSCNVKSFFKKSNVPDWLNIAFGYGAANVIGARNNNYIDNNGNWSSAENDFPRYRQWYLAPDIDFTKIKTKSKFLKTALFVLNSFKFPAPSLELSNGSVKWNWIHF